MFLLTDKFVWSIVLSIINEQFEIIFEDVILYWKSTVFEEDQVDWSAGDNSSILISDVVDEVVVDDVVDVEVVEVVLVVVLVLVVEVEVVLVVVA